MSLLKKKYAQTNSQRNHRLWRPLMLVAALCLLNWSTPARPAAAQDRAVAADDGWTQLGNNIEGVTRYHFGWSVALSENGSRIAIGTPYSNSGGHVSLYDWDGTEWKQVGGDIEGGENGAAFGWSVALSADGKRVAIGAPENDDNGVESGQVRLYDWNDTRWQQVGNDFNGTSPLARIGKSVALSANGNRVAIGGPDEDIVRVYDWNGSFWASVGNSFTGSAAALSEDGNRVVIKNGNQMETYDWQSARWIKVGQDIQSSGASFALSTDGNRVIVASSDTGHVMVYRWGPGFWQQLGDTIEGGTIGDESVRSIALSADGNRIALGAPTSNANGHVQLYDWDSTEWQQVGSDIDGEFQITQPGVSMALSADGERVMIGSFKNGQHERHARVFEFPCSALRTVSTEAELNAAIACYNTITTAGTYVFTLAADINLSAATTTIDNATAGVALEIAGNGNVLDADNKSRGFNIAANTTVTIDGLTMQNGNAGSNNNGGGIQVNSGATLTVKNSTIRDSNGRSSGAIDNSGTLTVENSTLSGNESTRFSGGAMVNRSMATIVNSTISGNTSSAHGGGLYNASGATLVLRHTTVTDNEAASGAGGITSNANATETRLYASIVAGNNGSGNDLGLDGSNSTYVSDGYNLIGTKGNRVVIDSTGDQVGVTDAKLGALADNGGSTQTHALLPGSPALNAGGATCDVATDQRGESRVGNCDIGAFERQGTDSFGSFGGSNQATVVETAFSQPLTLTLANSANEPVGAGGQVIFSAPTSGAGVASVTTETITATTDINGMVSVSMIANETSGSYDIIATVNGISGNQPFALTNTPPPLTCPADGVLYVKQGGAGAQDGTSWGDAFATVQDALWVTGACEIWVAAGVYYPDEGGIAANDDRDSTFQLKDDVAIYGGFAGTEASLDERDWETNITVLSGDLDKDDGVDANGIVTDTANIINKNSYHVVTSSGVTNTAKLDGVVITAGSADGTNLTSRGGGMYNDTSSPTVSNVTFSANFSTAIAGGMYNASGSSPIVSNVTFSANKSAAYAGGMFNANGSSPTVSNVTFSANYALSSGGGMFNAWDSSPTVSNVTFSANFSASGGGMVNASDSLILSNVTFSDNSADMSDGGGMSNSGSPTLTNVTFSDNSADEGGGMFSASGSPTLTNVTFSDNSADEGGGMFNASDSNPKLTHTIIANNSGGDCGGPDKPTSNGYNLASDDSCFDDSVTGDQPNTDPLLGPLADNGGSTQTHALLPGSPAIDAGSQACGLLTDQRGATRPADGDGNGTAICDIGAVEAPPPPFLLTAHTPITNALNVPLTSDVTATFDADVAANSVVSTSFAAHTQFGGLLTGTLSTSGNTVTLNPNRDLFMGEQVQVIATEQLNSVAGTSLTNPTQWGFTAGSVTDRCVSGFTDIGTGLTGVSDSSVAWGDYDNDGDLDILLTGQTGSGRVSQVYRNDGGSFTNIGTGLTGVSDSSVAWGDYDNDGDLDILLTGWTGSGRVSQVYRNDGGSFTNIGAGLTGVSDSSVAWGDYDNDGDLDILLSGGTGSGRVSKVYRNDGGNFSNIGAGLTAVSSGSVAWGDYDNDGDLDILLSGWVGGNSRVSQVYRNDGGSFSDIGAGLTAVSSGSVAWGDYDNDGDLDILLTGTKGEVSIVSELYENEGGGVFSNATAISNLLTGVYDSSVAWGDYDNDGDLDILLTGRDSSFDPVSRVYRNDDCTPELTVEKTASAATVEVGDTVTYTVVVTNSGLGSATGAVISDTLPSGLTFVANSTMLEPADAGTTGDAPTLVSGLTITAGTSVTVTYRATVDVQAGGQTLINTVGVTDAQGSAVSDTATIDVPIPFLLTAHTPITNALNVPLAGDVTATFDADVAANSVVSTSFAAHTQFGGLLTGTLSTSGDTVTLNPNRDLFMGEQVQVIATEQLNSVAGTSLTNPTQWGFTAGSVTNRCAGGFTDIGAGLTGVEFGSVAWGDYDNDGDLDILLTGLNGSSRGVSKVYRNDGGSFTDIGAGLTAVMYSSVAWGDYDNDGDLDILLTGWTGSGRVSKVYRNDGGSFTDIGAGLTAVYYSSVAWGDYDNDGDLDILLTGQASSGIVSKVYRNDGGSFSDIGAGLTAVYYSSVAWGDYDNDGDLDILLTGLMNSSGGRVSKVYRNDGGSFTDIGAGLTAVYDSSVAWGDYDNDGDLDILLTGQASSGIVAKVYRNDGGSFSDIGAGLTAVDDSSVAWGDYDNDGDLDILLSGYTGISSRVSKVYNNDGGNFTDIGAGLTAVYVSSVAWGDYDNDGDLDILLTGLTGSGRVSQVYRNDDCAPELTVEKTASAATVEADDTVTYTVTIENSGSLTSTEVVVSDTLPSGMTFVANSTTLEPADAGVTGVAPTLVSGLSIGVGDTVTVTYQATVDVGSQPVTYVNTVRVTDAEGSDVSDEATTCSQPMAVASAAELTTAINCYNDFDIADTYTISFTDDITLTEALPTIENTTAGVALEIAGNGFTLDADNKARGFNIAVDTHVTIDGLTIRNGQTTSGNGGGILTSGVLTIRNSTLSNNQGRASGAIDNSGTLHVENSTVSGNQSTVFNGGMMVNRATATIVNSTISGNTSNNQGGGLYNHTNATLVISHTTVTSNTANADGGAGGITSDGDASETSLYASIVAGNNGDGSDLEIDGTSNTFGSQGYNLIGTLGGNVVIDSTGDQVGVTDAKIGALADNGGATQTHALLLGSPAIDAADNANCPATDQRGESRPIDGTGNGTATCDIGAFESQTTPTFNLDTHSPTANALNVPLTSDVTATFDADVAANSVVSTSFAAHTQFSGLSTGTLSTSGDTVTLNPNRDLFMGEQVQVIATEQLNSVAGKSLTIPTQWGFTVGNSSQRCATFVEADAISAVLLGVYDSSVAWGDYDNDGKLDILLTGSDGSGRVSAVYKNEGGGVFSNATTISDVLTDVSDGSVAWGDYDNDGDLDILMNGNNSGSNRISRVYENEGSGVFSNATATSDALIDAYNGGVAWGDHDNDGDLDILLTGSSALGNISRVYENEGSGVFNNETAISDVLTNVNGSSVAWGDYDNDGDLDILMTGWTGSGGVSEVYKNEGILGFSKATTISDALTNVYASRVAWGDYDNDGDLDILLTGSLSGVPVSEVYENEGGGVFSKEITISNALTDVRGGDIAWGDYDNDGDLDILLTGTNNVAARVSEVYENEGGGVFSKATAISNVLTGVYDSSVAWGDYDNDGDLDILLTGRDSSSDPVSRVYRNDDCTPELTVEKTASAATVEVGDTVTYTVVITNSGLGSATGAVISDTLPSGLTFVANSTTLEPAGAGTTGNAPELVSGLTIMAGESVTVTYQATVDAGTEFETLVNTVGVTDAEGSDESDTASVTVLCSEELLPFAVDSAETLDNAIRCFNSFSTPDTYTISLTKNISLTTVLTTINNRSADLFLTIEGNGHALDGQNSVRLFTIYPSAPVQIRGLTMMNGSADSGGAIENSSTLTIENSTLVGNQATSNGGAILNYGQLTVRNSTISGNSAATDGGGINSQDSATIENSTIANNTANSGAGIYNLLNLSLVNSIVADNNGGDCEQNTPITSSGHNLDSDGSCLNGSVTGDQPNTDPLLGSLADNGGSTQTHALLHNSPAIDRANVASCTGADQRGEARDADHNCDIGAFELHFDDSPTVVRDDVPANTEYTFGPTHAKVTWRTTDPGTLSITKIVTETEDDETFDLIWTVNADNNSGLDLDITFCFLESEIPPAVAGSEAALMLYKQPSSGGAFTALSTTVDEANNCVTATVDGFSNFGIGLAAPTAVELDYFAATANDDGGVTVDWATASEVDHAGFNLYRRAANSRDEWTAINAQLIASRGTQAQGAEYQFVEQGVADGRWEYLLEDVENDGDVYRHLDAIETVMIGNPTAVTLTTRTAVGGSALGLVAQFIGLLLITVGAVVRSGGGERGTETTPKPRYIAPTVTSYSTQALQQQLGPARAFSERHSPDDELLFGEEF